MLFRSLLLCVVLFITSTGSAHAVNPDEILADPVLEQRARKLSSEIRCMVCQNQSIDDSDASVAKDLRVLVRERITAGDSDAQVLDYLVDRFGEFVLLKPRFSWSNAVLWISPFAALLSGIVLILSLLKRSSKKSKSTTKRSEKKETLNKVEQNELTKILGERD